MRHMISMGIMLGSLGKQIEVVVEAHGFAKQFVSSGTYTLKKGSDVKALLRKAGTSGRRPQLTFMIDGVRIDSSHKLADGDTVKVLGFTAGG